MFKKVLIANRGAIATRITRTLKKMGITAVAVYSEADAQSLHVTQADEAYSLGDGPAANTYLNTGKLFAIMEKAGIEAVHPGYGFLSENPEFVAECDKRHIVFIGPRPEHMNAFGLKHEARAIAQQAHVPLLAGSELLNSINEAQAAADATGYPIILKSTAGGGGIGMQICRDRDELAKNFDSVRRLGANNFANDGVFIEKYIEFARHIEVQVFGDGNGKAVAFGERDCSAQRRHQKVIEETPAPNIPDAVRNELHETATRLLASVNYLNAGTVEFIYDQSSNQFYFLEVNTRLQVEHGVSEQVFAVDLVEWMIKQAAGTLGDIQALRQQHHLKGHAIQARIYAEDPHKNFQPSAGLLSCVEFPEPHPALRIDHWIETGVEVSPYFDPMLAKIIVTADTRNAAIQGLANTLKETRIQGIETNGDYIQSLLSSDELQHGKIFTRFLNNFTFSPSTIDVVSGGTLTTIQDYPGRTGYWDIGVPPSGPFDNYSFRLGNRALGNSDNAAGLEITLQGPTLVFNCETTFILTGAEFTASIDDQALAFYQIYTASAGQTLKIGKPLAAGARAYLLIAGGLEGNQYLGSQATFTLGQFGGFSGRSLRTGDVLHLAQQENAVAPQDISELQPAISNDWKIRVIYGPHGAPDFFTAEDIHTFFNAKWEIHYNSSRTGIRLIGPKPQWARNTGGEAGMHPSNIHDNAYAIGTIDFTGDMPVILGPDGPSLGGFVCPATVIKADLWKLGQLKAGDSVQFEAVSIPTAEALERAQLHTCATLARSEPLPYQAVDITTATPVLHHTPASETQIEVCYRVAGDDNVLVEYGPQQLDIALRFRAHALMLHLQTLQIDNILELTPGIRSLQIHYNNLLLSVDELLTILRDAEQSLEQLQHQPIPARIVHLPLSWNDEACQLAVQKYMQSVRKNAPWCPDNIEFIRRINGLDSIEAVKQTVFDASYVVMGLGDVYLGAPVATPMDPRHRLVTTKYNPARTWTAENSVGIGGAYLCVYGMEGPGGYQFIGRTLQMWNKYKQTREFSQPWLLRFFDQIRFYEVSSEELQDIRKKFPRGEYPLKIEQTTFSLHEYQGFINRNQASIDAFTQQRQTAFDAELQHWIESGQMNFETEISPQNDEQDSLLPDNCSPLESPAAGSLWQWQVELGAAVNEGDVVCILESMKMEIEITAPCSGTLIKRNCNEGDRISAGKVLGVIENA